MHAVSDASIANVRAAMQTSLQSLIATDITSFPILNELPRAIIANQKGKVVGSNLTKYGSSGNCLFGQRWTWTRPGGGGWQSNFQYSGSGEDFRRRTAHHWVLLSQPLASSSQTSRF